MFYCMLENIVQFCYWPSTQWISVQQILSKSKQRGKHALVQLSFSTKYLRLNNIESSTLNRRNSITLFQRCFVNVETTSINIRWLNFHFQPNINVETTFGNRRWIDVILSTLFSQRWNNVEKCSSAQLSFSTKYQRWNNADERWRSTLF